MASKDTELTVEMYRVNNVKVHKDFKTYTIDIADEKLVETTISMMAS